MPFGCLRWRPARQALPELALDRCLAVASGISRDIPPAAELPGGLSLALILAEPVLRAHPEHHVLPLRVRVVGDVPVTALCTEVAAGHREPLGGIEFLLADDRPLDADIAVGRAVVLGAQAEPSGGPDRFGLARPAAGQHGQQAARLVAVPDRDGQRLARGACCRAQHADMHAGKELLALGNAHGNPHEGFIPPGTDQWPLTDARCLALERPAVAG